LVRHLRAEGHGRGDRAAPQRKAAAGDRRAEGKAAAARARRRAARRGRLLVRRAGAGRLPSMGPGSARIRDQHGVAMAESAIKSRFISHGTLGSKDLEASRRFYEEFLGLEVVRTSPVSLMVRLGGNHVYAVVYSKKKERMDRLYHNGLDVETDAEVDEAWKL